MKRGITKTGEVSLVQEAEYSGPSLSDLPRDILVNILLRLCSSKKIFVCKCVCKIWRDLISDPAFAKHVDVVKQVFYPRFGFASNSGSSNGFCLRFDSGSETDSQIKDDDDDIDEEADINNEEEDVVEEDEEVTEEEGDVGEEEDVDEEEDVTEEEDVDEEADIDDEEEDDVVEEDDVITEEEDIVEEEFYPSPSSVSDPDSYPDSDPDSYPDSDPDYDSDY